MQQPIVVQQTQDKVLKYMVEEDCANIAVGKLVKAKWGGIQEFGKRSWSTPLIRVSPHLPPPRRLSASQVNPYRYSLCSTTYFYTKLTMCFNLVPSTVSICVVHVSPYSCLWLFM